MKKIMFNDRYGLTDAVLQCRKTMTRRLVPKVGNVNDINWGIGNNGKTMITIEALSFDGLITEDIYPQYQVGEVVAIAQRYCDVSAHKLLLEDGTHPADSRGWSNKMFVKANLMPHHIKIIDIKVERLQDISDEDLYKEGFRHEFINNNWGNSAYHEEAVIVYYDKKGLTKQIRSREPKEAFSFLIDKISGYGTWENNPWVFAYEFELID